MNRIHQIDPSQTAGKTKALLDGVQARLGMVPNMMRVLANAPTALQGYLSLNASLASGVLPAAVREQIALTVSEINGCEYCRTAHSLFAAKAGLSEEDVALARSATAVDKKAQAVLTLARAIALQRGQISDAELHAARSGGLNDAEIVETIAHVALMTFTNYTNNAARTVLDFPAAPSRVAELAA